MKCYYLSLLGVHHRMTHTELIFTQQHQRKMETAEMFLLETVDYCRTKKARKGILNAFFEQLRHVIFPRGNNYILWKDWQLQVILKQRAVLCVTGALSCFREAIGETGSTKLPSPSTRHLMPAQWETSWAVWGLSLPNNTYSPSSNSEIPHIFSHRSKKISRYTSKLKLYKKTIHLHHMKKKSNFNTQENFYKQMTEKVLY